MKPYLSVVIVGRNDGYGENFLLRLNTFIKSLDYQVRYYPDLIEIILVEWNPPDNAAPLADVVHTPQHCPLRVITVPKETHDLYKADSPMLEYAAKNVGIVRAKGEFVLTTNPDIVFSPFIIRGISYRSFPTDVFFRTDRYDYIGTGIENIQPEQYVQFALNNTFKGQFMLERYSVSPDISEKHKTSIFTLPKSNNVIVPHTNACGDFILAPREAFIKMQGLWERNTVILPNPESPEDMISVSVSSHYDTYSLLKLLAAGYKQEIISAPYCIFHMDHSRQPIKDPWNIEFATLVLSTNTNNVFWGHRGRDFEERILQGNKDMTQPIFQYMMSKTLTGNGDSDKHTMTLFGMVLSLKPRKILELGVREGHTTLPILCAARECAAVVHSVDIEHTTFNCPEELSLNWLFFKMDAIKYLESAVANNEKYDIIYIDDWHSYDHVKRELELIDKISDPNTVILLHDLMYTNYQPNYHSNLNDPDPQWANGGPYRAVAELPSDKWEYATLPTNHGLTILRKRGQVLP